MSFSVIGTFAQELAVAWLVLDLTHSPSALGITIGLQFLPMLILAPWGGVLADRYSRRKILMITQMSYAAIVLLLWLLIVSGTIQYWLLNALVLAAGIVGAINIPARLGFLHELVGDDHLHNAVSLNSTVYSAGRVVGPALAGLMILYIGQAPVFLLNGLSYLGVTFALTRIHTRELNHAPKITQVTRQFRAGLLYIWHNPVLLSTLAMTLIVGIFTYEYTVTLPALAKITFHGHAGTLALLTSAFGLGAVVGGLYSAHDKSSDPAKLPGRVVVLAVSVILGSIQPTLILTVLAIFIFGFTIVRVSAFSNSILQLASTPDMRGRVLAIYTAAWVGSNAIGGPIVGWVAEVAGPRWALALGGLGALAAAALGVYILNSHRHQTPAATT